MNGLSPGALQKMTSFAQPSACWSRVSSAVRLTTSPISRTQSMLMPVFVEPRFTEEQTRSVVARACGIELMSTRSPCVKPFSTSAEKPPMKLMPISLAARSIASATGTYESVLQASAAMAIGVTETRLWMIGMPYSVSMSSPVFTRNSADFVILSYTFWQNLSMFGCAQSRSEMPIVIVRTSSLFSVIMRFVSKISSIVITGLFSS